MDNLVEIGLSIVSTSATGIIGYLMYRLRKHEEEKEIEERKRRNEEAERLLQQKKESQAFKDSLLALTRDRISQGYKDYRKQGSISTQDMETMVKLYDAYHALGGNGTITAIYSKITSLPIKEDW